MVISHLYFARNFIVSEVSRLRTLPLLQAAKRYPQYKKIMEVNENTTKSGGHSIEWGEATWNNSERSIRNRYDNVSTGKFNKFGSSEIPWEDFKMMIKESISRGELNNIELGEILNDISSKLKTL